MKLSRPAFCPAFRRRFFSSRLSGSGCPSCGAFASAGCATAPANRTLCGAPKRLFDAGRGLRDFRAARFEGTRCRREHDSGGRLSCCAGRVSGHCSDFLCAVLRGSDDRFARLRRHGFNHRFPLYWRDNAACPGRFPGTASGLCDRSGRSPCGGQWMRMSAAIGFCAMYFQRETPCASAPATGCIGSPVPTSQIVGIAKPVKPEPERSPYTITGVRNPWASLPRGHTGLGRDYPDTGRGYTGGSRQTAISRHSSCPIQFHWTS